MGTLKEELYICIQSHCWWFGSSSSLRSTGLEKLYRASSATSKLHQWGQRSELCDLLLLFPQHLSLSYLLSLYQSRFWQGILDLQPNSCTQQVTNTKSMLLSKQLLPATREMPGVVFVPMFIFNYNLMMVALNKMKAHIPDVFFTEYAAFSFYLWWNFSNILCHSKYFAIETNTLIFYILMSTIVYCAHSFELCVVAHAYTSRSWEAGADAQKFSYLKK